MIVCRVNNVIELLGYLLQHIPGLPLLHLPAYDLGGLKKLAAQR